MVKDAMNATSTLLFVGGTVSPAAKGVKLIGRADGDRSTALLNLYAASGSYAQPT
jgi:hypothetical protein